MPVSYTHLSGIGREGSEWFSNLCKKHNIETQVGTVDIGVRVEVRDEVMEFLNKNLYEAKLVYYTPTFDDKVRTCLLYTSILMLNCINGLSHFYILLMLQKFLLLSVLLIELKLAP